MRVPTVLLAGVVGLAACSSPAPPAPTALPPTTTTATQAPLPNSQVVRLTFPAGSTVDRGPDDNGGVTEVWTVPSELDDEAADVRAQLPINAPYDGLPWCHDDSSPAVRQWDWGTHRDFLVVAVTAHYPKIGVRGPGSEVTIMRGPSPNDDLSDCGT
ncbi:hypothetical protein VT930_11865 [Mycobacterium sherrisii]|uniref:hypothetical protein n=1 Tax=Mycobacterium sherrisii TaxID=243061 RepID=UPI002DDDB6CD|nr:hypothetical protein [Mycobacterium sherrisii]MEC4763800.1 hypothetical protein [Mycobacterium sherrisii]